MAGGARPPDATSAPGAPPGPAEQRARDGGLAARATPELTTVRMVEMSADVRAAVALDPAGGLVAASGADRDRARRLAALAHELVSAADAASPEPIEQIEAHTVGGTVFAVRDARYTLACVTRRLALPALVLYDLRQALLALEEPA